MKNKSVLTYVEILCLAARALEHEIAGWEEKGNDNPSTASLLAKVIEPLEKKLDAIRVIYKIETGEDYI